MAKNIQLFEFLCELIDIQIKKYVALTKIGVGPDAGMNAKLVLDQTKELFRFANELLSNIEKPLKNPLNDEQFKSLFNQVRFYLKQEYLRGYAAWLIDENSIHNPEFERLKKQKIELEKLASQVKIDLNSPLTPQTPVQQQCEHDSNAIAFLILDTAIKLKENPNMELSNEIPDHARKILKSHVAKPVSRYNTPEIWAAIAPLYEKSKDFLSHSQYMKSNESVSKDKAILQAENHNRLLQNLLHRFHLQQPNSVLFSPEHQWYNIGKIHTKSETSQSNTSSYLTHGIRLFGGIALGALVYYLCQNSEENSFKITNMFR